MIAHADGGVSARVDCESGVPAWLDESHQLAKMVAYGKISGFTCGAELKRNRISLDQSYADEPTTVVEEQLAKAGIG